MLIYLWDNIFFYFKVDFFWKYNRFTAIIYDGLCRKELTFFEMLKRNVCRKCISGWKLFVWNKWRHLSCQSLKYVASWLDNTRILETRAQVDKFFFLDFFIWKQKQKMKTKLRIVKWQYESTKLATILES